MDTDEDFEETPAYYRRPQPQRQRQVPVQPPRSPHRGPNVPPQAPRQQPQVKRNIPVQQTQKKHVQPRQKLIDLDTCHRAATRIQTAFRGHQVRKLQMIPKLKQLAKVEQEFKIVKLKFEHTAEVLQQLWTKNIEEIDITNYRITHKKLLECEEDMTKKLISLDSISSGQSQFIRTIRKQIVEAISATLHILEPIKKTSIQKLQQLQEYNAYLEQQKLAEQERQREIQNANTKVEPEQATEELSGNSTTEEQTQQEDPEILSTVSEPMEEEPSVQEPAQESCQEDVVVQDVSQSNSSVKNFDPVALSSLCYQTIQEMLNRQNKLLEEKDNYIKTLQSRIEQLEQKNTSCGCTVTF